MFLKKASASDNKVFTLRLLRSLGLPEGFSKKLNQADNPALAKSSTRRYAA
ncbi:hypothetical protein [Paenibacillus sp. FSL K6-2524]|uniref:hypothetical protein n=1 Tax=Paenibacillus sp. FSL K6-2524 TaxID=2954516 RepID=UPI0030F5255F